MHFSSIIDISPAISSKLAVFPGDTPFSRDVQLDTKKGDLFTLSSLNTTVHLGAHTDAPNHYHADGVGIDQRSLNFYLGPCQVIEVSLQRNERILPEHLNHKEINQRRVLFKTNSFPDPNKWNDDFNALSPQLIEYLQTKNVILVGIDTPSVDLANDKELLTHTQIYKNDMAILEGIILKEVDVGSYQLIALPLKIVDGDASPVRAVLLPIEHKV